MTYDKRDKEFVARVSGALYTRVNINTNKQNGVMTLCGAEPDDQVNPELKLTKDEIKQGTGRVKLRDVTLAELKADFEQKRIDATIVTPDNGEPYLHLQITPARAKEVKFDSLNSIEKQNEAELSKDPELGTPYYEY